MYTMIAHEAFSERNLGQYEGHLVGKYSSWAVLAVLSRLGIADIKYRDENPGACKVLVSLGLHKIGCNC